MQHFVQDVIIKKKLCTCTTLGIGGRVPPYQVSELDGYAIVVCPDLSHFTQIHRVSSLYTQLVIVTRYVRNMVKMHQIQFKRFRGYHDSSSLEILSLAAQTQRVQPLVPLRRHRLNVVWRVNRKLQDSVYM